MKNLKWRIVIENENGTRGYKTVWARTQEDASRWAGETIPVSSRVVSIEEIPPDEEVSEL